MVRTATDEDTDDVARLIAEFRDWWGKVEPSLDRIRVTVDALVDDPATEFLLALEQDETAVGVCQLRYRLSVWTGVDDCWLEDLFVSKSARARGRGTALVEAAIEHARAHGCKRIELDVNEQNPDALRFYESLGFTTEPKPPGRTLFLSRAL